MLKTAVEPLLHHSGDEVDASVRVENYATSMMLSMTA